MIGNETIIVQKNNIVKQSKATSKKYSTCNGNNKKNQKIDANKTNIKGNKISSKAPTSFSASTNAYEESNENKNIFGEYKFNAMQYKLVDNKQNKTKQNKIKLIKENNKKR